MSPSDVSNRTDMFGVVQKPSVVYVNQVLHKYHLSMMNPPSFRTIHRASDKLFADATQEVARTQLESGHENWTGEESMQDAVLRMLVDKYKPPRSWPVRTADQKLKESPPQVRQSTVPVQAPTVPASARPWHDIANAPLLPSIEGHRPWHTTFKPPPHATASIKSGNISPRPSAGSDDGCGHTRRTERELEKRKQQARRLSDARESTLDYQLGLRRGSTGDGYTSSRINPVSLKGWQSLIEERIEVLKASSAIVHNSFRDCYRKHDFRASSTR